MHGTSLLHFSNSLIDCLSGGKPVLHYINETDVQIFPDQELGALLIINCSLSSPLTDLQLPLGGTITLAFTDSVVVTNCECSGVFLYSTSDVIVNQSRMSSGYVGCMMQYCANCTIANCNAYYSKVNGFSATQCSHCLFINCTTSYSNTSGFWIDSPQSCLLSGCTATYNQYGFYLTDLHPSLDGSEGCVLHRCSALNNQIGFYLSKCRCGCNLSSCWAEGSPRDYYIEGNWITEYASHSMIDCWAEGRPVRFLANQRIDGLRNQEYGSLFIICLLYTSPSPRDRG